jgi:uncharacterized protein (DUF2384 family)
MHSGSSNIAGDTATAAAVPPKATLDKANGDPISVYERRKEKGTNKRTSEQTSERTTLWDQ